MRMQNKSLVRVAVVLGALVVGCTAGNVGSEGESVRSSTEALDRSGAGTCAKARANSVDGTGLGGTVGTPHLSEFGAPLVGNLTVQPVYWKSITSDPKVSISTAVRTFIQDMAAPSAYLKMLVDEYGTGTVSPTVPADVTITPKTATGTLIKQSDLELELSAQVTSGALPISGSDLAHTIYLVTLPSGYNVVSGSLPLCVSDKSGSAVLAYHNHFAAKGATGYYILIPNLSDHSNPTSNPCGRLSPTDAWTGALTALMSHELAETITDPAQPTGWSDARCGEIADICGNTASVKTATGHTVNVATLWSNRANACVAYSQGSFRPAPSDFNGDGKSDIAVSGLPASITAPSPFSPSIMPVALGGGTSFRYLANPVDPNFVYLATWTGDGTHPGVRRAEGDFDGDGLADVALIGGTGIGYSTIPVSFGAPALGYTNKPSNFPVFADQTWFDPLVGDFDGDGRSDIALVGGGPGWGSIPVAYSNGDGSFSITNAGSPFAQIAQVTSTSHPTIVAGDFNGDGQSDLAAVGGSTGGVPWAGIYVAYGAGPGRNGSFNTRLLPTVDNSSLQLYLAQTPKLVVGDFDGNGLDDIGMVGGTQPSGQPWGSIVVLLAQPVTGSTTATNPLPPMQIRNTAVYGSASAFYAAIPVFGARVLTGDYDGDGVSDVAIAGGMGASTLPVALGSRAGYFVAYNNPISPTFSQFASQAVGGLFPSLLSAGGVGH